MAVDKVALILLGEALGVVEDLAELGHIQRQAHEDGMMDRHAVPGPGQRGGGRFVPETEGGAVLAIGSGDDADLFLAAAERIGDGGHGREAEVEEKDE